MKKQLWLGSFGVIGLLGTSLLAPTAQAARTALPGTINYIEGQASIDGNQLTIKQEGDSQLQADQILSTARGNVEVLLSPGVIVRVGNNSQLRMVSPELINPRVEVLRGEAMVEVDLKPKEVQLDVLERGADAMLLKEGIYKFDADEGKVSVIDGKADVTDNGASKELGRGKEVVLTGAALKPVSFDRKAEDQLYRWSQVRASYLAQANEASARTVYVSGGWGGYGGYGPGWFWNPYFSTFSWLPGDGYFFSPFGYPFFSPGYVMYAPRIVPGYVNGGHVLGGSARSGFVQPSASGFRSMSAAPHFGGGGGGFHR
jgi:hypothetical protein